MKKRPPRLNAVKAPEDRHSKTVCVRLTADEHADALAVAAGLGISVSRLMRSRAEALPAPMADRKLALEFGKIGSNLNQIAHKINTGTQPDLATVAPVLEALRASLEEFAALLWERK
jgi:hypothetical protein